MFRQRPILVAILILTSSAIVYAQSVEITAGTNPGIEQVRAWLRSGYPYFVAWGAYFASRSDDDGAVTIMLQLAERWTTKQVGPYPIQVDAPGPGEAMSEILYALIERGETVPPEAISAVAPSFPVQAAILATRLSPLEASPLLQKWYDEGEHVVLSSTYLQSEEGRRVLLARIAAMMLSKDPPPGYAASILSKSEEKLDLSVVNSKLEEDDNIRFQREMRGKGLPPKCEDYPPRIVPGEHEPPLFQYHLEENPTLEEKETTELVTVEGDTIRYRRAKAESNLSTCYPVMQFNEVNLHQLLAQMLGVDPTAMPWQPHEYLTLQWEGPEKFLMDVRKQMNAEEAKLRKTAPALYAKGLLTQSEAQYTRPLLVITAYDHRDLPRTVPPLPRLVPQDSHITYDSGGWQSIEDRHESTLP